MDLVQSSRQLISDMIGTTGSDMKLLLMDTETTPCVSCAFSQSELMQKEVLLFDKIDRRTTDEVKTIKCVVFARPTPAIIDLLIHELQCPLYSQYYLFFTSTINKLDLKKLAESDKNETVREVQEIFLDNVPLRKDLFTLNMPKMYDANFKINMDELERIKHGVIATLLQLKKNPVVRYQKASQNCAKIAEEVSQFMKRENLLFNSTSTDTLLLIVERSFDVVTPLLNQWTYEAMIHELLGITNNRLTCESQSIVLNELSDDFFAENINANFGEIGQNIKTLIGDFQEKRKINQNLDSILDMKKFVEDYPQFKKISGTVSKHVSLVGELSRLVQQYNLLEISELEQSIVSGSDHAQCLQKIKQILRNPKTRELDVFRLILLYALRFKTSANNELNSLLHQQKNNKLGGIVENCLKLGGSNDSLNEIFGRSTTIDITKRFIKGLKGVENIYTQHSPQLKTIVENLQKGKCENYPSVEFSNCENVSNIVVFIVGGATYEEAAFVRHANNRRAQGYGGPSIVLGSNCILNTKMFIDQLSK